MLYRSFLLLCSVLFTAPLLGQLSGVITDDEGNTLPYASIYIEGTSNGTTTNIDGYYDFALKPGAYTIIYQYVGFSTVKENITIDKQPLKKDIILSGQGVNLSEVVIAADAEDPAYAIIRKAIKKRPYYKDKVNSYKAGLYIKGLIRTSDVPEKFFGQSIGDMEGILDSTRQGIIYLSESQSELYYKSPNKYKEVMYASKVAGSANGVSFNQFADSYFNFYEEYLRFSRDLITPIADKALSYYKYKLIRTTMDDAGRMINEIEVIPKSKNDPIFFGKIYITEDIWNIHSVDLSFEGKAAKNNLFDTISIKQVYVPIEKPDTWMLFSQILDFSMGFLAFKFDGTFSYVFSDYEIDPVIPKDVFNNEIFRVSKEANEKDTSYWSEVRPIPLTKIELKDYVKKDSLEILWNTETYRDSIDRINNKFKLMNLLVGYSYDKSYNRVSYNYNAPLSTFVFNPVEGYKIAFDLEYQKSAKNFTNFFTVNPVITYSFAEKKVRALAKIRKKFNSINNATLNIALGRKTEQFNSENPISPIINTFASLLYKTHHMKLYERDFIDLNYSQELVNSIFIDGGLSYNRRRPLILNSNQSWAKKEFSYPSNDPQDPTNYGASFVDQSAAILSLGLVWNPGQKYLTFDEVRVRSRSGAPTFSLLYNKGLNLLGSDVDYDKISLKIKDTRVRLRLWGYLSYNIEAGTFLRNESSSFIDRFHFNGNQVLFLTKNDYLESFKLLPYYAMSTNEDFMRYHLEYHPKGRIMDRLPLLKNTNASFVFSYAGIINQADQYSEISLGIERISLLGIPLLRVDYSWSFSDLYQDRGITIGVSGNF